ncbi:NAD-dependent protein deacetylase sirtuin-2 isoform X4 [Callorhinus ursinus]|uniref:NAD-dependent protein deacetylase sirtuin-2 isoform X4 n=1 Tax=Callorhinus ursinus TaxID=34884 RepID=UPI003CD0016D
MAACAEHSGTRSPALARLPNIRAARAGRCAKNPSASSMTAGSCSSLPYLCPSCFRCRHGTEPSVTAPRAPAPRPWPSRTDSDSDTEEGAAGGEAEMDFLRNFFSQTLGLGTQKERLLDDLTLEGVTRYMQSERWVQAKGQRWAPIGPGWVTLLPQTNHRVSDWPGVGHTSIADWPDVFDSLKLLPSPCSGVQACCPEPPSPRPGRAAVCRHLLPQRQHRQWPQSSGCFHPPALGFWDGQLAHEAAYEGHSEEQQLTEPSPFARHWARHSIGVVWTEEEAEAQRGCDSMQGHTSGKRQAGLLNPEHMLPPTWPQLGPAGPGPMAAPRQSRGLRHPCTGYPRSP